jgi:hypothetical protein
VLVTADCGNDLGRAGPAGARRGYCHGARVCGGGCAASLCKSPAHEGQHLGVRGIGEEPAAGLSLRVWERCSPPWGRCWERGCPSGWGA